MTAQPPATLRALSLWQPIASLIGVGAIRVETRDWKTDTGPLVIHAAKSKAGMAWCEYPLYRQVMARHGLKRSELPLGVAVAVCDVVEVVSTNDWAPPADSEEYLLGDYDPDRYALILDNIRLLQTPVEATGRQKVWRTTQEVHDVIVAQLGHDPVLTGSAAAPARRPETAAPAAPSFAVAAEMPPSAPEAPADIPASDLLDEDAAFEAVLAELGGPAILNDTPATAVAPVAAGPVAAAVAAPVPAPVRHPVASPERKPLQYADGPGYYEVSYQVKTDRGVYTRVYRSRHDSRQEAHTDTLIRVWREFGLPPGSDAATLASLSKL